MVREAIADAGVPVRTLAREAGLGYNTLRSWIDGRRSPTPDSLHRLAGALRARGERLMAHARRLEAAGE